MGKRADVEAELRMIGFGQRHQISGLVIPKRSVKEVLDLSITLIRFWSDDIGSPWQELVKSRRFLPHAIENLGTGFTQHNRETVANIINLGLGLAACAKSQDQGVLTARMKDVLSPSHKRSQAVFSAIYPIAVAGVLNEVGTTVQLVDEVNQPPGHKTPDLIVVELQQRYWVECKRIKQVESSIHKEWKRATAQANGASERLPAVLVIEMAHPDDQLLSGTGERPFSPDSLRVPVRFKTQVLKMMAQTRTFSWVLLTKMITVMRSDGVYLPRSIWAVKNSNRHGPRDNLEFQPFVKLPGILL